MPHSDDPLTVTLVTALRGGDGATVRALTGAHPGLAAELITDGRHGGRTPLHVVTDWPGFFPNGPAIAGLLLEGGADPDARTEAGGADINAAPGLRQLALGRHRQPGPQREAHRMAAGTRGPHVIRHPRVGGLGADRLAAEAAGAGNR